MRAAEPCSGHLALTYLSRQAHGSSGLRRNMIQVQAQQVPSSDPASAVCTEPKFMPGLSALNPVLRPAACQGTLLGGVAGSP
jgi:hypothetical protein